MSFFYAKSRTCSFIVSVNNIYFSAAPALTGSVEVVKALNEYINTWGRASGEVQNEKYRTLLQVMRKDLNVDKKIDEEFPSIGLCDIDVKR